MIKWGEFVENGMCVEAFLPEHEKEPQEWVLLASRAGNIVGVRRERLTWVPRMGPDMHDVANAEAAAEALLSECVKHPGGPIPSRDDLVGAQFENGAEPEPPPNPIMDAWKWKLIERFAEAAPRLGLETAEVSRLLGLRPDHPVQGLLPFAVRKRRFELMQRLSNIAAILDFDPERAAVIRERVRAVLATGDCELLKSLHDELVGPYPPASSA